MSFSSLYERYPAFFERLAELCPSFSADAPLKMRNSFRLQGTAAATVTPQDQSELCMILDASREMAAGLPLFVLGKGSNILIDDQGIEGLIIFTSELQRVDFSLPNEEGVIFVSCECGTPLFLLNNQCVIDGRAVEGLAFSYGIPGSIGGAIVMNAGAFDEEMAKVVEKVDYYDLSDGSIKTAYRQDLRFSYRHSLFSEHPEYIILSAVLKLKQGNRDAIIKRMSELFTTRNLKQPTSAHSAGSTFKRPPGFIAARLIDECGLKGYRIGGAAISEKHAGFIINEGNATTEDIKALIKYTQNAVYEKFGVRLECEIQMISTS